MRSHLWGSVFVTNWVVSRESVVDDLSPGAARRQSDVVAYRDAVNDVLTELASLGESPGIAMAERILARRLPEPEFAIVLSAMPSGPDAAIQRVLQEVRTYRQSTRSSAGNLPAMIRIALLAQIDVLWWGHLPAFQTDADVLGAGDLLDLDVLRRDRMLLFRYRRQASSLIARAARSAERLAVPDRVPHTAGLRFACARPELIVLLNQVASNFARLAPGGTPRLWVTSLVRSVEHQRHLRDARLLGPAAERALRRVRHRHRDAVVPAVPGRWRCGLLLDTTASGRDQRDRRGPGVACLREPRRRPGAPPGPWPADGGLSAMCGIALIGGHGRGRRAVPPHAGLAGASRRRRGDPRGERPARGTQRLRIVDRERAVQPWLSADGRWRSATTARSSTTASCAPSSIGAGHELRSESDTEVVLEAFLEWGEAAVAHFRGEFAFADRRTATGRVYLARDPSG